MSEQNKPNITWVVVQLVIVVLVAPLLPMIISGDWNWWQGWVYAAVNILSFVVSRLIVNRVHPDLIRERARGLDVQDTKPWDKVLAPMLALGTIFIAIVAGADRLYGWSSAFPGWVHITAIGLIVLGYTFSSWALVVNRFFSGTVRIQTERGHHVVTDGPYRIVRHPGYAGALLGFVLIPLLLDSVWAFIPAGLLTVVVIIRTALEDATLQEELPGYAEYAQKTRYRLIPGVW
ncbi:MAG: isoprenylcysteine carboxylmethyltransferase family protein [Chloroflexota bacterium]